MRTSRILPVVLFAVLSAAVSAQPERADFASLTELAPKLVRLQNQFEQMVPNGVSIEAREISRTGTPGKDLDVRYNIYVKGVPSDSIFRQIQWPVDQQHPIGGFRGLTQNKDGEMICAGRTPEQCHNGTSLDSPMVFAAIKPLKGEPRRFAFISGKLNIPISIVPDPIEAMDNGCKLSAIRLSARFELALIEGSGFPPDADIRLRMGQMGGSGVMVGLYENGTATAQLKEPTDTIAVKTDANGKFQAASLANIGKSPAGTQTAEALGAACDPKINYTWGVF